MKLFHALPAIILALTLSGCGVLMDSVREAAGYPSAELMRARKSAVTQSFDVAYDQSFEQALKILEKMKAVTYAKNKKDRFVIAMKIEGCIDTTEVGIFFKEESPSKTSVEIFSRSPKAQNIVSTKIFTGLVEGK